MAYHSVERQTLMADVKYQTWNIRFKISYEGESTDLWKRLGYCTKVTKHVNVLDRVFFR